jgi:pilus assembly protein CpaD
MMINSRRAAFQPTKLNGRRLSRILMSGMASALLLAACGETSPQGIPITDFQAAPRTILKVDSQTDVHTVMMDRSGRLSPMERERLQAFLADFGGNRPESLRFELRGSETGARRLANLLTGAGFEAGKIAIAPSAAGGLPPSSGSEQIVMTVTRLTAVVPECPGWIGHTSAPTDNRVNADFGCSDVSNLARMVADPGDLVKGQSSLYGNGDKAALGVSQYRTDQVKDLSKPFEVLKSVQ